MNHVMLNIRPSISLVFESSICRSNNIVEDAAVTTLERIWIRALKMSFAVGLVLVSNVYLRQFVAWLEITRFHGRARICMNYALCNLSLLS